MIYNDSVISYVVGVNPSSAVYQQTTTELAEGRAKGQVRSRREGITMDAESAWGMDEWGGWRNGDAGWTDDAPVDDCSGAIKEGGAPSVNRSRPSII